MALTFNQQMLEAFLYSILNISTIHGLKFFLIKKAKKYLQVMGFSLQIIAKNKFEESVSVHMVACLISSKIKLTIGL